MRGALVATILGFLLTIAAAPMSVSAAGYDKGPDRVYFPSTGHYLAGGFLDYWHTNGDLTVFGNPISDEIGQNGLTVQYFERAVLEYHADAAPADRVQPRLLGQELLPSATQTFAAEERRFEYFASMLGVDFTPSDPFSPVAPIETDDADAFFPETGHTLTNNFKNYWELWGGVTIFGYPISEKFTDPSTGRITQYFERAVFEWNDDTEEVMLRLLGNDAARQDGVNTAKAEPTAGVPNYDPGLWQRDPNVKPADITLPPPGAPFGKDKWIEVDLTQQYLRAWQGRSVVFSTYISTGLDPNPTPPGYFQVYQKLPKDEMTNGPHPPPGETLYDLKDVPNVMYFLGGGYAIHGAYWHWNFGQRVSHGCVNLPLDAAAWMYNWTPLGTEVWIHT